LKESIRQLGLQVPIEVIENVKGAFDRITGNRRVEVLKQHR
jgi:ParB-like chromosome segregation protein Spo0J